MAIAGAVPAKDFGGLNIVGIYARWTLDCIVEGATAIAHDYRKRYREYRNVDEPTAEILANVYSRMGYDPAYPDTEQRAAINTPLVSSSDAQASTDTSPFHQTALNVRTAAVAYSERVYDTGEPMLRQAFIDAARHFEAYLATLSGGVINRARKDTESIFRQSVQVLTSEEVAQAFGLPPAPPAAWPLPDKIDEDKYLNGNGAYLIEAVSRLLQPPDGLMTQQRFLTVQRIAVSGARTIQGIVHEAHNDKKEPVVKELIEKAYTWATALRDFEVAVSPVK